MGWSLYLTRDRSLFGLPEPIEWLSRAAGTVRKSDIDISKQVASKLCEKKRDSNWIDPRNKAKM